jgi:hypothetical protein
VELLIRCVLASCQVDNLHFTRIQCENVVVLDADFDERVRARGSVVFEGSFGSSVCHSLFIELEELLWRRNLNLSRFLNLNFAKLILSNHYCLAVKQISGYVSEELYEANSEGQTRLAILVE